MKVGASKGVIRVDVKKIMAQGGGGSGQPEHPLDTPLHISLYIARLLNSSLKNNYNYEIPR